MFHFLYPIFSAHGESEIKLGPWSHSQSLYISYRIQNGNEAEV